MGSTGTWYSLDPSWEFFSSPFSLPPLLVFLPRISPLLPPKSPGQSDAPSKLTIEVTAGDKADLVENASVYVKYMSSAP